MNEPLTDEERWTTQARARLAEVIADAHGHDEVWLKDSEQAARAVEALHAAGYAIVDAAAYRDREDRDRLWAYYGSSLISEIERLWSVVQQQQEVPEWMAAILHDEYDGCHRETMLAAGIPPQVVDALWPADDKEAGR